MTGNKPGKDPSYDTASLAGVGYIALLVISLVFTPKLRTLDTNAVRFMLLALINLIALTVVWITGKPRKLNHGIFFTSIPGFLYFTLLVIALLSFTKSLNINESVITWFKLFTGFTTALIVAIIVRRNNKILYPLSVFFTLFLLFDSLTVFYHIAKYISGLEASIVDIKSVYGNKNIFGASLFMKIPFALWLFTYKPGWNKYLGIITSFFAFAGILFLSIRSFFLGSMAILLAYSILSGWEWLKNKNKALLLNLIVFTASMFLAVGIYSLIQNKYYPKSESTQYTSDVATRFSTIANGGGDSRIKIWDNTFKLIEREPLLGVGTGNWKVAVLEIENKTSIDYTYKYKVHNDFLEITSESGILAGIVFALIFLSILGFSGITVFNRNAPSEIRELLFIPLFGIIAYFFDAFFNFPSDRPEILVFFSFCIGTSIAVNTKMNNFSFLNKIKFLFNSRLTLALLVILLSLGFIVLYMNFKSAQSQAIVYKLYKTQKLATPADEVNQSFPSIPDISVLGEPIASNKAYTLMHENRYDDAVKVLRDDHSSPWDSRREHYIAKCFFKTEQTDSALKWALKAYAIKPYLLANVGIICTELQKKGNHREAQRYIIKYLNTVKSNAPAYQLAAEIYYNAGDYTNTTAILDSGLKVMPDNELLINTLKSYQNIIGTQQYKHLFEESVNNMKAGKYKIALEFINQFILNVPNNPKGYGQRSYCEYYLKMYEQSIADINKALTLNETDLSLVNLRGVNYHALGKLDLACADFKMAKDKGRTDAADNYRKFCEKNK